MYFVYAGYVVDQALQRLRLVDITIGDLAMPYSPPSCPYPHIAIESATVAESNSRHMLSRLPLTAGSLAMIRAMDLFGD